MPTNLTAKVGHDRFDDVAIIPEDVEIIRRRGANEPPHLILQEVVITAESIVAGAKMAPIFREKFTTEELDMMARGVREIMGGG